jgi:competence protein ComEA
MFKKFFVSLALLFAAATAFAAVDVNKADQASLESVKGIGTKVSVRILDERKKGPFKDWSDLMARVKGIKQAAATRLSKEGLTVNGSSFEGGDSKAGAGHDAKHASKKP